MLHSETEVGGRNSGRSALTVPLVDAGDVARAVLFALLAPTAWWLPPRLWPPLCGVLARGWANVRTFSDPCWPTVVADALGARQIALAPGVVRARTLANNVEFMLQLLKMARPGRGGWEPHVELVGREHIDEGLQRGRGIVLWVHRFRPFVHFIALRNADLRVHRPSAKHHGEFFRSRIGRSWLNPIQTAVEDRYCERVLAHDYSLAHLRALRQLLTHHAIVSMYADHAHGTRNIDVPFLAGSLAISTQAVSLAAQTDSWLLPVFPLSDTPGRFRVIVERNLELSGKDRAAVDDVVRRHARRLEWYVLQYPDQWSAWWRVRIGHGQRSEDSVSTGKSDLTERHHDE